MDWSTISHYLQEQTQKFNELAKETAKRSNEENIHKLRVTSRRLRTVIDLAKQSDDKLVPKKLRRRLKKLGDALGEARELDVAHKDADEFHLKEKRYKGKKKKTRRVVQKHLRNSDRKRIVAALEETVEEMVKAAKSTTPQRWRELEAFLQNALEHPPRTPEARHKLRIKLKTTRYLLEGLGSSPPIVKKMQDALGRKHDLEMLREIYGDRPQIVKVENEEWDKARGELLPAVRAALDGLVKSLS